MGKSRILHRFYFQLEMEERESDRIHWIFFSIARKLLAQIFQALKRFHTLSPNYHTLSLLLFFTCSYKK
jgi:hypothetical protein